MRLRLPSFARFLYLFLVIILALLLLSSCVFLLSQAVRTAPNRTWTRNINALVIGASYILVLAISLAFCLKRRLSVRRQLSHIPTSRIAISKGDIPKVVHRFIEEEFLRSCTIAYVSQPKVAYREGWGRPGTTYEGVRYRTAILDTVPVIDAAARRIIPSMPRLAPNVPLHKHMRHVKALLPANDPVASLHPTLSPQSAGRSTGTDLLSPSERFDMYMSAVERARYAKHELHEDEFIGAMHAGQWLLQILEVYQRVLRERGAS